MASGTAEATLDKSKYTVNGLTYTKMGLITVFSWLLWGAFIFNMMETVKPQVLPLFLMGDAGKVGASMSVTNLMMVVVPGITGILIGPAVSFKSDRYRSKRGRRIPFITWTTPPLVIGLIGMGLAPWYRDLFEQMGGVWFLSAKTATLLVVGFFVVMFHVFDEFVNSVFWYLFADVVPEAFIGRFMALFNMVGRGAYLLFMGVLFRYAETHFQWIYIGIALVYLVGLTVVCWKVKEGEYPPPDDLGENPSILKQIKVYVVECFSHRIYICVFLFTAAMAFATGANAGLIIFHRDGLGLSMDALANAGMIIGIFSMVLAYPSGWAVDKWHPLRITLLMTPPLIVSQFLAFFLMKDLTSYVLFQAGPLIFLSLFNAANVPMLITVFPKDKYGQFCSCNGMVRSTAAMIGGMFAGPFMDAMTRTQVVRDGLTQIVVDKVAFRWVYVWTGIFQIVGLYFLWLAYRAWKNRGGDRAYVPPGSALEKELLAKGQRQPEPPEQEGAAAPLPA